VAMNTAFSLSMTPSTKLYHIYCMWTMVSPLRYWSICMVLITLLPSIVTKSLPQSWTTMVSHN
jgi:hypothetical protein